MIKHSYHSFTPEDHLEGFLIVLVTTIWFWPLHIIIWVKHTSALGNLPCLSEPFTSPRDTIYIRFERKEISHTPLNEEPPLPGVLQDPISDRCLEYLLLIYLLLYCPSGDEAVDGDGIFLPEAPSTILCLSKRLRVPIWFIKYDSIRSVQVTQKV